MPGPLVPPTAVRIAGFLAALAVSLLPIVGPAQTPPPETPAILSEICNDEYQAVRNYRAFAKKALEEDHPAVAHFFDALASSETIHARNFLQLLRKMNLSPEPLAAEPKVQSTRKNLRFALDVELREIDTKYPGYIARLKRENQEEAVKVVTWSWESEKQHRDLIKQLEMGTGIFFGVLSSTLESRHVRWFICQVCGSTYVQMPEGVCPICLSDSSNYREVPPPPYTKKRPAGPETDEP